MTRIKLEYVHEYRDRHGKVRRYVRRRGFRAVPLPGLPGTPEFMAAYHAALTSATVQPSTKATAGTLPYGLRKRVELARSPRSSRISIGPPNLRT